jgi:hypothetical protein
VLNRSIAMTCKICDLTADVHVAPEKGEGGKSKDEVDDKGGGRDKMASANMGNIFFSQKYAKTEETIPERRHH